MARLARLTLASQVHHLQQRGNGDQLIMRDEADAQRWLALLAEGAQALGVDIHAYVLLPDGWQMLATPHSASGIPALMQTLGRRYVRYYNDRYQRRGALFEGRYRSTLIDPQSHLLAIMTLMDWLPVRAGLVARPADWSWSSHAHYAGLRAARMLKLHPAIWTLGNTPFAREAAYVERVGQGLDEGMQVQIQAALAGWALGSAEFVAAVQQASARRVVKQRAGRPQRQTQE